MVSFQTISYFICRRLFAYLTQWFITKGRPNYPFHFAVYTYMYNIHCTYYYYRYLLPHTHAQLVVKWSVCLSVCLLLSTQNRKVSISRHLSKCNSAITMSKLMKTWQIYLIRTLNHAFVRPGLLTTPTYAMCYFDCALILTLLEWGY